MSNGILPYRTDAATLAAYLEACARGRAAPPRLRERGLWGKALEGTVVGARELGFLAATGEELTEAGRRFALGEEAERRRLVRAALLGYVPYAEVLGAVQARGEGETDTEWVETWWATRGRGNSPSNRTEGAVVFGRLVDFAGWGRFVQGRRGHATRIEWAADAPVVAEAPPEEPAVAEPLPAPPEPPNGASEGEPERAGEGGVAGEVRTRVVVRFASGEVARLELPGRLPAAERARLLAMVGSLVEADLRPRRDARDGEA